MEKTEAGKAGLLGMFEIILALLFGILFFEETIQSITVVGVFLIMVGTVLPSSSHFKKKPT